MKNVDIISRVVARKGETLSSSSKGAQKIDFSDYLLKSIWEKAFKIRTDSQGTDYIFSKLPVVTQYGITMYSGDGVDVPSIASGLPFDGRTIWYNPDTNQIEVIGGTGGGSGEGVSNFWDLSGIPSWITISKPKYTYSEIEGTPDLSVYATQNWIISQGYASAEELKKYIPISGYTEVSGEKNFTGGLKVNGSPIYYDTEKKYWKLEGDLLVTGGVTMYGVDSTEIPSLINSLPVASTKEKGVAYFDPDFFSVSSDGKVSFIGETGGGLDIVSLQNYLTQNSYLNVTSGDNRYLKLSGGTIDSTFGGLEIKRNNAYASTIKYSNTSGVLGYIGFNDNFKPMLWNKSQGELGVILHSGNYSNYALPLSGGTLSSSTDAPLYINRKGNAAYSSILYQYNGVNIGVLGFGIDGELVVRNKYSDNINYYKIWHEGNDGADSGLDADLLDGYHRGSWNGIPSVLSNGVMDIGKYIDFHNAVDDALDYATRLECTGAYKNWVYLPSKTGTLALITDNVAGATKLVSGTTDTLTASGVTLKDTYGRKVYDVGSEWFSFGSTDVAGVFQGYSLNFKCGSITTMVIKDTTGNVGIGTSSPSHKLHVVGNTYLNGDVFADELNTFDVLPRTNNAYSCGNSSLRWYQVYGNIGDFSGAVNMGSTLNVTGMTTMTNATITGYLRLKDTTNYGRAIYFGDGEYCYLEEASDDVLTIYANAGIKLNTSSTSYNVSINTNLLVSGGITMYSQRSLKNIQDERGLSLGELGAIKPIRYTWKDNRDNRLHIGGIADDIQQVLPEVVYKTNDGVLTMDYGNAAFAIASSLIKPVVDHEKRIAMLEEENKQLRQEVERLKSA